MAKVVLPMSMSMSMSLDGFVAGPDADWVVDAPGVTHLRYRVSTCFGGAK